MSAPIAGGGAEREPRRVSWGHVGAIAGKMALSIGLFVFLFRRVQIGPLLDSVRVADPRWLAAAVTLFIISNLFGSYQWGRLLRVVDIHIPYWKVCAYYHVGLFFNNFLPANIGGDIARVSDASRYGPTKTAALSAVLMDRLVGTVALAGLALVTTLPALNQFHLTLVYAALVGFFALSVVMVWAVFHPAVLPALERLLARVGMGGLGPHLDDLAARLHGYRGQRGLFGRLLVVGMLTQVSRVFVHALVARALGIDVPLIYFFLFVPLLAVIVSLPISLNGIGVREGAGIVLFGLVGVDRAHAFSLQFTTYLVAVSVSLLGGLVFLIRIPHRRAASRDRRS
ncbi:MAG: lysylphosphatidylglycerol synthase transmembrane domain-containing protein [Candidatus Eisenbacteria bacterium]